MLQLTLPSLVNPLGLLGLLCLVFESPDLTAQPQSSNDEIARIKSLDKSSTWTLRSQTPLAFDTFHPQGMVKVGEHFFLTSVQTFDYSNSLADFTGPPIGYGHVFKFDLNGVLVRHITLGEGALYHPGGIDFDGESLWIPVAEYRPNSKSIVYKVDPDSMVSTEVLRFDDHLGAIVRDTVKNTLHGMSWGSRRIYSWQQHEGGYGSAVATMTLNPSHYIDYQDCQYLMTSKMVCSGLGSYRDGAGTAFKLGGIDLIDLDSMQPIFQLPVTNTAASGALLTQNPFFAEFSDNDGLIFYFLPDDNQSVLYGYSVR
jgi:hypothetical protein